MSRLRMTKAALAGRRRDLAVYQRALPSLELKRQQLVLDLAAERMAAVQLDEETARLVGQARAIRFAADRDVALEPLLAIIDVARGEEMRLGVALPAIGPISWASNAVPEGFPPWVAAALAVTRGLAEARLRAEVAQARVEHIERALRRAVQRINLLQQVLMPRARHDIAHIATFLADGQRMATARSKLLAARKTVAAVAR